MMTLEGFSSHSAQDAVAQALTAAGIEKPGEDERLDLNIVSVWEDDDGFHAKVAVQHTKLGQAKAGQKDKQVDLKDAIDREAGEFLALFVPDAAHQYRKQDEDTETMKEEPRFAELHEKFERDFDRAEHPQDDDVPPDPKLKATHPEPHIEGTAEEEDR